MTFLAFNFFIGVVTEVCVFTYEQPIETGEDEFRLERSEQRGDDEGDATAEHEALEHDKPVDTRPVAHPAVHDTTDSVHEPWKYIVLER